MIRSFVKTTVAGALSRTGMSGLIGRWSGFRNVPAIVAYHRVVEDFRSSAATSIPSMLVSRRTFEQQLDSIGRSFRFISLDELGARLESGKEFDRPVAAITFDDGYRDFYYVALPVLKAKCIPATLFVVTATIGAASLHLHDKLYLLLSRRFGSGAWKRSELAGLLQALGITLPDMGATNPFQATRALLEALPQADLKRVVRALESEVSIPEEALQSFCVLTWEMLDEIRRAGVSIGSHTRTHILMTNESGQRLRDEVVGSRRELERKLDIQVRHFAYPSGHFDPASVNAVAAAGYRFAYTACTHRDRRFPLLTIPRTVFWENSCLNARGSFSPAILNCQINRVFDLVGGCRQAHGTDRRDLDDVAA